MRFLAAILLVLIICVPVNAEVGSQWDVLIKSQNEVWVKKSPRARKHSTSLSGVVGPLAAKAREIASACGSKVISAVRHTRIAGTRTLSLHASGRAVDMQGNPSCIYRHLANWPGGYSIDYARVRHVHISLGGREDGLRFAHGGGSRKARHAKRKSRSRYATAQ